MTPALASIIIGITFGLGLWFVLTARTGVAKHGLTSRIAPYVSDLSREAHVVALLGARLPHRRRMALANHVSRYAARNPDRYERLQRRLQQAGSAESASEWIVRRAYWMVAGLMLGVVVGSAYAIVATSPLPVMGFALIGFAVGWWFPRAILSRRTVRRMREFESEMASGLDILTMCISAGEDITAAITRIGRLGTGPFSAAMLSASKQVNLGVSVADALDAESRLVGVPSFSRAVEHVTTTLERGTPLVETLAAQVRDIRESAKRNLIESAGKNEVLMLFPLVFLILPVTIAFAVFPGLVAINAGVF